MGHYLSEMQSDPVETSEYKKWKKEFPLLREKIAGISMSLIVAGDLVDVLLVLNLSSRPQGGGTLSQPLIFPPKGTEEAMKAAKYLVKKYCAV